MVWALERDGAVKRLSAFVALVSLSVMSAGCQLIWPWIFNNDTGGKTGAAELYRFKSAEELKEYLADQVRARTSTNSGGWLIDVLPIGLPMALNGGDVAADQRSEDGASTSGDDYSTTNLQEEGVDESDVMKNDGQYVYLLKQNELRIAKVQPPDALEEIGQLELEGYPDSIYLRDGELVALTRKSGWYGEPWDGPMPFFRAAEPGGYWNNETLVTIIDATDPNAPSIKQTYRLEGDLVSSRMIEGRLHLVMTLMPELPEPAEIPATPLEDLLPKYVVAGEDGVASAPSLIADWDVWYRPIEPDGYGFLTVVSIDTTDPNAEVHSVAVTADAGVVYASTEALYVTDTDWGWSQDGSQKTVIHKFSFGEEGAEYTASGAVPGRPVNQFSLGEYEDHLRIATTIGWVSRGGQSTSTNNVFVLAEGEKGLDVVGEVRDIAPGEQIYSARFLGPRGFLVTFKKIDPLFTLDLSDPNDPKVVGKLKVPGYSDYIHILDDTHLLTIGKDAEDVGDFAWYQGVQLSVFDVTNFSEPELLHKQIIGGRGTESEALHNHKAFNFYRSKGLLAIPIDLYEGSTGGPTYGTHTFTGLYVYRVSVDEGFELLGRISTVDLVDPNQWWYYYNSWTRGVFIGDYVYAVTDTLIRSAAWADAGTVLDTLKLSE